MYSLARTQTLITLLICLRPQLVAQTYGTINTIAGPTGPQGPTGLASSWADGRLRVSPAALPLIVMSPQLVAEESRSSREDVASVKVTSSRLVIAAPSWRSRDQTPLLMWWVVGIARYSITTCSTLIPTTSQFSVQLPRPDRRRRFSASRTSSRSYDHPNRISQPLGSKTLHSPSNHQPLHQQRQVLTTHTPQQKPEARTITVWASSSCQPSYRLLPTSLALPHCRHSFGRFSLNHQLRRW